MLTFVNSVFEEEEGSYVFHPSYPLSACLLCLSSPLLELPDGSSQEGFQVEAGGIPRGNSCSVDLVSRTADAV